MRQKGFAHLLLIFVVVIIGVGAIGYLSYQNAQLKKETEETVNIQETKNVQTSPTSTIVNATPTSDPTKNWITKTYSTYQIKYPTGLTVNEQEASTLNISKWGPTQTEGTELYDGFSLTFQPRELPGVTPEDFANSQIKEVEDAGISEITENPTPITINNYKGVYYVEEGLGKFKHIILGSNDGIMLMQISILVSDPGNLGFQDTVDQILYTFTFLN